MASPSQLPAAHSQGMQLPVTEPVPSASFTDVLVRPLLEDQEHRGTQRFLTVFIS